MTARVEGDERIIAKLVASVLISEGTSLLSPAADLFVHALRSNAPRGATGNLVESITVEVTKDEITVGPDKSGFYGFFLEYGTSKMSARPWFRPAVDRTIRPASLAVGREFARQFERVWR